MKWYIEIMKDIEKEKFERNKLSRENKINIKYKITKRSKRQKS